MTRKTTAAITTACVSAAACTAAYMMSGSRSAKRTTKQLRRNAGKALRQVGDFIGNVSYMMK